MMWNVFTRLHDKQYILMTRRVPCHFMKVETVMENLVTKASTIGKFNSTPADGLIAHATKCGMHNEHRT